MIILFINERLYLLVKHICIDIFINVDIFITTTSTKEMQSVVNTIIPLYVRITKLFYLMDLGKQLVI